MLVVLQRGGRALDGARQIIGDTAFQHDFTELPGTAPVKLRPGNLSCAPY